MDEPRMKTITELVKEGWSKEVLMRIAHMKDTPFFRTGVKGRFYVLPEKLEEFVSTRRVGR